MRLRPTSEYIEAIRTILPGSEADAMNYGTLVQQTAGRLRPHPGQLARGAPKRHWARQESTSILRVVRDFPHGERRRSAPRWIAPSAALLDSSARKICWRDPNYDPRGDC